jgi:hypothetical protein
MDPTFHLAHLPWDVHPPSLGSAPLFYITKHPLLLQVNESFGQACYCTIIVTFFYWNKEDFGGQEGGLCELCG